MELYELIVEMKLLERRLALYEEKYGVLSADFYKALMTGSLERFNECDETRTDFSHWKGIYETWLRRKRNYDQQISKCEIADLIRVQLAYC
jgi:hypothetical protein